MNYLMRGNVCKTSQLHVYENVQVLILMKSKLAKKNVLTNKVKPVENQSGLQYLQAQNQMNYVCFKSAGLFLMKKMS